MNPGADRAIERRLRAALALLPEITAAAVNGFEAAETGLENKADGSPVTATDRAIESILRQRLRAAFPTDALLGEEHGAETGSSGLRWILDPIDGTVSFVRGVPLFGTLIALEVEATAEPVLGIIHLPALAETVWARSGGGAWHRLGTRAPVAACVSRTDRLSAATVCMASIDYFDQRGARASFLALVDAVGTTRGWSDCYAFVLLATGRVDAVVEPVLKVWDLAAPAVIVREAGGRYSDWQGRADTRAADGVLSNGRLHTPLLGLLGKR